MTKAIEQCFAYNELARAEYLCRKVDRWYAAQPDEFSSAALFFTKVAELCEKATSLEWAASNFKKAAICHTRAKPSNELEAKKNFTTAAYLYMRVARICKEKNLLKQSAANLEEAARCSKRAKPSDGFLEAESILAKLASCYSELAVHSESKNKLAKAAGYWMNAGTICARKISNREKDALIYLSRAERIYAQFLDPAAQDAKALSSNSEDESLMIPEWLFDGVLENTL